jgi:hypothetical protein
MFFSLLLPSLLRRLFSLPPHLLYLFFASSFLCFSASSLLILSSSSPLLLFSASLLFSCSSPALLFLFSLLVLIFCSSLLCFFFSSPLRPSIPVGQSTDHLQRNSPQLIDFQVIVPSWPTNHQQANTFIRMASRLLRNCAILLINGWSPCVNDRSLVQNSPQLGLFTTPMTKIKFSDGC